MPSTSVAKDLKPFNLSTKLRVINIKKSTKTYGGNYHYFADVVLISPNFKKVGRIKRHEASSIDEFKKEIDKRVLIALRKEFE